jgi:hypothetical protein
LLRADIGVEPRGVIVSQWMLTSTMNFEAAGRHRRAAATNPLDMLRDE